MGAAALRRAWAAETASGRARAAEGGVLAHSHFDEHPGAGRIGHQQIDLAELNEAFAVQSLAVLKQLGLSAKITNVNGGSIAMGHPLGATGAMILGTIIDELERRDLKRGLATLCVGGGMGIATIVELV